MYSLFKTALLKTRPSFCDCDNFTKTISCHNNDKLSSFSSGKIEHFKTDFLKLTSKNVSI